MAVRMYLGQTMAIELKLADRQIQRLNLHFLDQDWAPGGHVARLVQSLSESSQKSYLSIFKSD